MMNNIARNRPPCNTSHLSPPKQINSPRFAFGKSVSVVGLIYQILKNDELPSMMIPRDYLAPPERQQPQRWIHSERP